MEKKGGRQIGGHGEGKGTVHRSKGQRQTEEAQEKNR